MAQDIIITPGGNEPKIEFTGSSVTAPSVNLKVLGDSELSFEEGSNKLLYIGDDIGIGTTNPTEKLHVVGNAFVSDTITANIVSGATVSGANIAEMDSILSTHENEITDLQGDVTGLDSRLTTAESDISLAEADITNLEASATNHESRISSLESAPGGTSDHGALTGLGDDDHTQYVLATGARSMNSLSVTGNISVTGTVDGRDIAADGTKLDNHVASGSVHFTEASIDHGSIDGLDDDDHQQYVLATGARDITGDQRIDGALDVGNVSATWNNLALDVVWDHLLPHDQNGNWNAASVNGGAAYQQNQGGAGTWMYDLSVNPNADTWQGVMTVSNGNTTTTGTAGANKYHTNPSTQLVPGATHYFRVATSHAVNCHIRFGLLNGTLAATATPIRACYAEFNTGVSTDLRFITDDDGAAQTTTTTSFTPSLSNMVNNFWWFAIKVTDEGSGNIGVGLYDIDGGGTLLAKHTTNLPDPGTDRAMRAFIQCISAGATYRSCYLDTYGVYIPRWLPPNFVH